MIEKLIKFIQYNNLDGYILPKNDKYFTEYSNINNLAYITKFTGSAGFALFLKDKKYLFIDGRYTQQANKQAGKEFTICEIPYKWPKDFLNNKNLKIGFDPNLFTEITLYKYFQNKANLVPVFFNFKNKIKKRYNNFFSLSKSVTGESNFSKLRKVRKFLYKNKCDYLYVSSGENVCWLLNMRGKDLPNSPLANCKLLLSRKGKSYIFTNLKKISKLKNNLLKNFIFCNEDSFYNIIYKLKKGTFCIDQNTCSIFDQELIKTRFRVKIKIDPIYSLKSIKNNFEIKNTIKAHVIDGVALTKFIYWFKCNKKQITEKIVENKLENFRKKSKSYLFPSFDTIAGSGPNGSIIHYKSNNKSNRIIKKNDILLIDSGGQYKWGTTDVTRTLSVGKISKKIKNNFTRVLKGHIAVVTCDLKKHFNGHLIDILARKSLQNAGLNYAHGTGHGVGFFLNVHEGPQSISKNNTIRLKKGMILSNEPGYYLKDKYGIRIENLVYVDEVKSKLVFKNLTYTPIDLDMINFKMLNNFEKKYLFDYHLDTYSKISKFLNKSEKKWLINLIK